MAIPTLIDRLAEEGYIVLPDLIPTSTLQRLRVEADAVLTCLLDQMEVARTTDPRVTWWRLATGRMYVLKVKPVLDLAPMAAGVAACDVLRGLMAELLGGRPQLMEDKFMYKQEVDVLARWATLPVLGEEVCKHTDAAYFAARGFSRVLTVAVCLDDCTEATGALRVWPGTHRQAIEHIPTANQGPVVPDDVAPDRAAVLLEAFAGAVMIWDSALVHASGPNTTSRPRRLLVLGYTCSTER
ncbi:phytanoyl-CoA dioxygenase family protein [Phytohabitans sp. ZYX-F-186]|uniref:Phytanoyl-CoA dioxygenase family protein n=1 Tax=Phytohabitans maris TaxID=3071409 RepID=A0ABU0Z8W1_9ACTN|nr:phytanoyl-CoA dioxygenase family protein [Phytohabitans sp. ZYX-F-186]MDQ7903499.1 phytanoyl-CoA dioxygenase family protein [Phytohabitans sp. ZYX-F-186]